jgi:hypothetical protein
VPGACTTLLLATLPLLNLPFRNGLTDTLPPP